MSLIERRRRSEACTIRPADSSMGVMSPFQGPHFKTRGRLPLWRYVWWTLCGVGLVAGASSIALPKIDRAGTYAQEVAAIAAIRTIQTAELQYSAQFGRCGSLRELGDRGLIDAKLASRKKSGYRFQVTNCAVEAQPLVFDTDGSRTFYSDSAAIHEHYSPEAATAADPETK
jgi:hypothetical protein